MEKVHYSLFQEVPDRFIVEMEQDGWTKRIAVTGETQILMNLIEKCTRCELDPVHFVEVLEDYGVCPQI